MHVHAMSVAEVEGPVRMLMEQAAYFAAKRARAGNMLGAQRIAAIVRDVDAAWEADDIAALNAHVQALAAELTK